jgi:hypothetical protein
MIKTAQTPKWWLEENKVYETAKNLIKHPQRNNLQITAWE